MSAVVAMPPSHSPTAAVVGLGERSTTSSRASPLADASVRYAVLAGAARRRSHLGRRGRSCRAPRGCTAVRRRRQRRTRTTGPASMTLHQTRTPIISGEVTLARVSIATRSDSATRRCQRALHGCHGINVLAFTASSGISPGFGTPTLPDWHTPDTTRCYLVTDRARRIPRAAGLLDPAASAVSSPAAELALGGKPGRLGGGGGIGPAGLAVVGHGTRSLQGALQVLH